MNISGAIADGFVGTLVLTAALSAAGELGLTRMDLPFLLGRMVFFDRSRAKALGYAMHVVVGQLFALVYFGIFTAIGHSERLVAGSRVRSRSWPVRGIALVNVLLPVIHPRMGHTIECRRRPTAVGTTGIHDAQLRPPHAASDDHRPRCLRHDRGRVHIARRLRSRNDESPSSSTAGVARRRAKPRVRSCSSGAQRRCTAAMTPARRGRGSRSWSGSCRGQASRRRQHRLG